MMKRFERKVKSKKKVKRKKGNKEKYGNPIYLKMALFIYKAKK